MSRELAAARTCTHVISVIDNCLLQHSSYRSKNNLVPKEHLLCYNSLTWSVLMEAVQSDVLILWVMQTAEVEENLAAFHPDKGTPVFI